MVGNVIMLGAFTAIIKILNREAFIESIKANVPKEMKGLNLKAFEKGYKYGLKMA